MVKLMKEIVFLKEKLKKFEDQRRELEDLNDQWENSNRILEYSKQSLEEKLYLAEENAILYKEELGEISNKKEEELQRLRDEIKDLKQELLRMINQHGDIQKIRALEGTLNKAIEEMSEIKKKSEKGKNKENTKENSEKTKETPEKTKKTSEICNTVRVYAKVRPLLESDTNKTISVTVENSQVFIKENLKPLRSYLLEKAYGDHNSNNLFNDIRPTLQHFAAGGSCCILSYGQTGSGKTYTMNDLIVKSLESMPEMISNDSKVSIHCIEVYNEQVRDLLTEGVLSRNWKDILRISNKSLDGNWIFNAKEMILKAGSKRFTKTTDLNDFSSRSHCIYTIILEKNNSKSILQFVDLAGSERISKSAVIGDTLKEALHINRSLSALQDVVSAIEHKSLHVPYRNSLLTRLLKPSLSTNSKIVVILNCSPTEDNTNESISTLSLGMRLKAIDLSGAIKKNLKTEEVERTFNLLEKERFEKNNLARKVEKLEKDVEGYIVCIKEKEAKITNLLLNLKNTKKTHFDQNEIIKFQLKELKTKQLETERKLRLIKTEADHVKLSKTKKNLLIKTKLKPKRVLSAEPLLKLNSKLHEKAQTPTKIPKPGCNTCNSFKN